MAHEHHNDICPDKLPESEILDDDCYECEMKKQKFDEHLRHLFHEEDFGMTDNDPEDEDADGYDGDDELSYEEGENPTETQTRPFEPEDALETWLEHVRLSATGDCDCIVCETDRAKIRFSQESYVWFLEL